MDGQRDGRDDDQHHRGQAIHVLAHFQLERPDREPVGVRFLRTSPGDEVPEHGERHHEPGCERGDPIDRALPGRPLPEEQRQRGADEWEQGDHPCVLDRSRGGAGGRKSGLGRYHLRRLTSSTLIDARLRNSRITIARPIPTSAAATAITKSAKIWPPTSSNDDENATRFTFTAFSISSIAIRTMTAFRRAR